YLVNLNFSGPHSLAAISGSGEVQLLVSDPWDFEGASVSGGNPAMLAREFARGLTRLMADWKSARVAVAGMEFMEARFVQAICRALDRPPVSGSPAVEEIRRVKHPDEIERIKQAAVLADRGYQHFAQVIEAGMAEYELVAEVEGFLKSNGAEENFMLIASGGAEVTGMRPPTERRFQNGDFVTTELTPQLDGYFAQICRTLVIGEPNSDQQKSFAIFEEAQRAAQDLIRPGIDISEVARVQNDVFRRCGFGEYTGSKYTRVRGHNLGLHPDETPYVLEDVHYTLKEGMVVIAHPNTYLPLSGYMVFGDTLLITADGCVSLNKTERKLFQK
ncbi:MAG TPA: Xaa-Pro peptidase family protein, partial [Bryobacteraceae bacterium]|nr:Xaa-Pro peptidase family protein [Bryobacteraceae bacterium]